MKEILTHRFIFPVSDNSPFLIMGSVLPLTITHLSFVQMTGSEDDSVVFAQLLNAVDTVEKRFSKTVLLAT